MPSMKFLVCEYFTRWNRRDIQRLIKRRCVSRYGNFHQVAVTDVVVVLPLEGVPCNERCLCVWRAWLLFCLRCISCDDFGRQFFRCLQCWTSVLESRGILLENVTEVGTKVSSIVTTITEVNLFFLCYLSHRDTAPTSFVRIETQESLVFGQHLVSGVVLYF